MTLWVTIPTAGRDTLEACVDSTGIPRDRIVIVVTARDVLPPKGCRSVYDLGPINIQRWWNLGINIATAYGATRVAVLNDDILLDHDSLPTLLDAMGDATLATPGHQLAHHSDPAKDRARVLDGACWIVNPAHGLRADEQYRWWYGDDDLDYRARRDHHGIVTAPCAYQHLHCTEATRARPDLQALATLDRERWMNTR